MNSPILLEMRIGSSRYDLSGYTPEEVSFLVRNVNAVQELVQKKEAERKSKLEEVRKGKKLPSQQEDFSDDEDEEDDN